MNQVTESLNGTGPAASTASVDFDAIKQRQQATWASGDFAVIGTTLQIVGETLAEALDIRAGERVLDVAAGNGNATLAAAHRLAQVTAIDYVPQLLTKAAKRADAEGVVVEFQVADAENLPFSDGVFDVALSTFGAMFTPQHAKAASELLRVVRSGGRIGMANWTPEGFIGQLFRVIGAFVPPPAGAMSPALWGTRAHLLRLFGAEVGELSTERRIFSFRYRSAAHWIEIFRTYYGPTHKAFSALGPARQVDLAREVTALLDQHNVGGSDSLVVPAEYLEVVAVKK